MYITLNHHSALDVVLAHDRLDQFGSDGWLALFDHIERDEFDTGEETELDVIALCCEWARFDSVTNYNEAHGTAYADLADLCDNGDAYLIEIHNSEAFLCYAH